MIAVFSSSGKKINLMPVCSNLVICGLAVFIFAGGAYAEEKQKAEYVGMSTCAACHEEKVKDFKHTAHAKVELPSVDEKAEGQGCEACHGPGSLHIEDYHNKANIKREDPENCYRCHSLQRGEFSLQYHHPVPEGRIKCSSCHELHKVSAPASIKKENETCLECHQQYKGPYVFEHLAMEDGCKVCHKPHGSINTKLLIERDYNLCLKCHYSAIQFQRIGHYAHRRALNPSQFGPNCTGCHRGTHGSNFSKELRTQ